MIEENGGLNLYGYCGNDGVGAFDPFGLLPKEKFNELKALLGGPGNLTKDQETKVHAAVKARLLKSLKFGPDILLIKKEKPIDFEKFINHLTSDMIELGRHGGEMGFALFARTIEEGETIYYKQFAGSGKVGPNEELGICLDIHHELYQSDLAPVLEDWYFDDAEKRKMTDAMKEKENATAWRSSTVIAHEMGHSYVDLLDPFNVILVQNKVAEAFKKAGLEELIRWKYDLFRPIWPSSRNDYHWYIPRKVTVKETIQGDYKNVPLSEWRKLLEESRKKSEVFLDKWGRLDRE